MRTILPVTPWMSLRGAFFATKQSQQERLQSPENSSS